MNSQEASKIHAPRGLVACIREHEMEMIPVRNISVFAEVHNTVAVITSTLTYQKVPSECSDAWFIFPMDDSCAIYFFQATIGAKIIKMQIQEKEQARDTYNRAFDSGQKAFLLEQDSRSDDVFRIRIGNIQVNEFVHIVMKYVTALDKLASGYVTMGNIDWTSAYSHATYAPPGAMTLVLPTVLNPRYDPNQSNFKQENQTREIVINRVPYDFSFKARIKGSKRIVKVFSPTEEYDWIPENAEETVGVANLKIIGDYEERRYIHDLQLCILYDQAFQPHCLYEIGRQSASEAAFYDGDVVMLSFLPSFYPNGQPDHVYEEVLVEKDNEFVFIIDQSGSMNGTRIEKAREALMLFLKSLPVGCYFQLIGFGTDYKALFPQPVEYSEKNLRTALNYKEDMQASMGSTEIMSPLFHAFSQSLQPNFHRQVFLLTDGEVANTDEVIEMVRNNSTKNSVYVVGIGDGVSSALVRGVARAGGGRAEFIRDSDDNFSGRVISLLHTATQPKFQDISVTVQLPADVTHSIVPHRIRNIFQGQYLHVFLYLKGNLASMEEEHAGSAVLRGTLLNKTQEFPLQFHRPKENRHDDLPLHVFGAKCYIQEITDSLGETTDSFNYRGGYRSDNRRGKIKNALGISLAFNIVSRYASFVGVEETSKEVIYLNQSTLAPEAASTTFHPDSSSPPLTATSGFGGPESGQHSSSRGRRFREGGGGSMNMHDDYSDDDEGPGGGYPPYMGSRGGGRYPRNFGGFGEFGFSGGHGYPRGYGGHPRFMDRGPYSMNPRDAGPTRGGDFRGPEVKDVDPHDKLPLFMRQLMGLAPSNTDVVTAGTPAPPTLARSPVIRLAELIRPNGSWEAQHDVYRAIQANREACVKNKPAKWTKDEWVTLLVIYYLETKCLDKQDQWSMLVKKARYWLNVTSKKEATDLAKQRQYIRENETALLPPSN